MKTAVKRIGETRYRADLEYIVFTCLNKHVETYDKAMKIARALIRNGVRPC
jgi:hypothetical protein